MIFRDPEQVFSLYEQNGGNYKSLKELRLEKKLIEKKFPELAEKEYTDSAEFMFWLSYLVERDLSESIAEIEVAVGRKGHAEAEKMIDDMGFGQKIKFIIQKSYVEDETDPYVVLLWEVKKLRDHMAHGRLHQLNYKGYPLSHPKGQIILTVDLANALRKKGR